MPGVVVVSNPRSRRNRRDPALARRLEAIVGAEGRLEEPATPEALRAAAQRARDEGVEVLAVNGGDGTSHVVLTAFVAAYGDHPLPAVALLRGGTMNTVASSIGVHGTPVSLLERLLARRRAGAPIDAVERNLLCVPGETPQYGFLFGNGLISNFLEVYYESAEPTPTRAAWILARAAWAALAGGSLYARLIRPIELGVEVDGAAWPTASYLTVGAGTVDEVGLRFRPFHLAPTNPDRLHAVAFGCTPARLVRALGHIWMAAPPPDPDIRGALARRLRLRADHPIPYMIDGDFHAGAATLDVCAGPRIRLLRP